MRGILTALMLAALPCNAASLCDADPDIALRQIAGVWAGGARVSLENEVVSVLRDSPPDRVEIGADGTLRGAALAEIGFGTLRLRPAGPRSYDVDQIDDLLETTGNAALADILSDTPCGPEALPQLVATLDQRGGMSAKGTLALIPYFTDRILAVSEMTLRSEETVIFVTSTGLLRPAAR